MIDHDLSTPHCRTQTTSNRGPETRRTHATRYCQVLLAWRAAMSSCQDANCTEFSVGHAFYSAATSCGNWTDMGWFHILWSVALEIYEEEFCVRAHFEWANSHIIRHKTSVNVKPSCHLANRAQGLAEITCRGVHANLDTLHATRSRIYIYI